MRERGCRIVDINDKLIILGQICETKSMLIKCLQKIDHSRLLFTLKSNLIFNEIIKRKIF